MSFPAYPEYTDSGAPWLEQVPAHWELSRIGARFAERRQKVSDADYPPLSVTKNGIVPQLETAAKTDDNDNRKCVLAGDFVINSRSDRKGSSGLSSLDGSVSLINTVIEPDATMHGLFVHHLFRSVAFQEEYYRYGKGIVADLWSTNYGEMKAITLAVPPIGEQEAIAAFLDRETAKIDALLAEQERLIALLKEKRQAVISNAVTKGLNPDAPMKDSGIEWLGEIPAHWEVDRLKFVATVQTGLAKGKDYGEAETLTVPYLRVANVQDGYLALGDVAEIEVLAKDVDRYRLKRGDVLMNEGGDYDKLGRGHIWNGEIDVCLHQNHVFAVRPHGVSSAWLNMLTGSDYAQQFFVLRSKQTTNLASISSTNLMELPIILPPLEEQEMIENEVKATSLKTAELVLIAEQAITLLKERRAALISAAVTGKIDVRGLVMADNVVAIDTARAPERPYTVHGAVGAQAIAQLGKLGRMAVMKGGFLAEAHAGITEIGGRYERAAAGPYSRAVVQAMERDAVGQFGITVNESDQRVGYAVPQDASTSRDVLRELVGQDCADRLLDLLDLLKDLGRGPVEAVATLYAAWNDLLAQSGETSDEAIINEVLNEWDAEKADKFTRSDLETWLAWMRRHGIVPDGTGPRTDHQVRLF